jgi:class 3 adenylate cyclase
VVTTKHIAVLFTDLVGSTELQPSLTAKAANAVRDRPLSSLRRLTASWDGPEVKGMIDLSGSPGRAETSEVTVRR